jgi:hypothetical protein
VNLSDQGLFLGFARFELAAERRPMPREPTLWTPLYDQYPVASPQYRNDRLSLFHQAPTLLLCGHLLRLWVTRRREKGAGDAAAASVQP